MELAGALFRVTYVVIIWAFLSCSFVVLASCSRT